MKLFTDYLMPWWQVGLLKLYVMSIGLILGAYFAQYVQPYIPVLLVVCVLLAIYFLYQMFTNRLQKSEGEY